jgi:hypothetical protein
LLAAGESDGCGAEPETDAAPEPLSLPSGMTVPHRRQARGVDDLP